MNKTLHVLLGKTFPVIAKINTHESDFREQTVFFLLFSRFAIVYSSLFERNIPLHLHLIILSLLHS